MLAVKGACVALAPEALYVAACVPSSFSYPAAVGAGQEVKHRKVPRWVDAATTPPLSSSRNWPVLSDMIDRIEVRCEQCQRHGRYRADRLLAEIGDVSIPMALDEVAKRAGCLRAINPPSVGDVNYATRKCQIQLITNR